MQVLKAGLLYFALVFGLGLVLGTIRTLWIVPRIGTRMAEPAEAPFMLVVSIFAARWVVRVLAMPSGWPGRLAMGCIALGLMLMAEVTLVRWLRGISLREYFANRDRVSGTVYYILLGVFAVMPVVIARG